MNVYPSILEKTWTQIERKIDLIPSQMKEVQIDVCDGRFVPSKTYASAGCISAMERIAPKLAEKKLKLEFDLMVDLDYSNRFDRWVRALYFVKPKRVIFHYGSTKDWGRLFAALSEKKKLITEVGLGVHLDTPIKEVKKLVSSYSFSFIQVMGIEKVGYSGQSFSNKTYAKLKKLRELYPDMELSVDGGVKVSNAARLQDAGATRICPNSGLFKTEDINKTYKEFKKI